MEGEQANRRLTVREEARCGTVEGLSKMTTTRAYFETEMSFLQDKMLEMATCADTMVAEAVEALMTGDLELVKDVVRRDDTVDQLDLDIEAKCLRLIATQQPVARDLRVIGTA